MAENGPLEFRTVLYSNYDEKLGNHERKTLVLVSFCSKPQYQVYFSLPHAENSRKLHCSEFWALNVI